MSRVEVVITKALPFRSQIHIHGVILINPLEQRLRFDSDKITSQHQLPVLYRLFNLLDIIIDSVSFASFSDTNWNFDGGLAYKAED